MLKKTFTLLNFIIGLTSWALSSIGICAEENQLSANNIDNNVLSKSICTINNLPTLTADVHFRTSKFVSEPGNAENLYEVVEVIRNTKCGKSKLILAVKNVMCIQNALAKNTKHKNIFDRVYNALLQTTKNYKYFDKFYLLEAYDLKSYIVDLVNVNVGNNKNVQNRITTLENLVNNWFGYGTALYKQASNYVIRYINLKYPVYWDKTFLQLEICIVLKLLCKKLMKDERENLCTDVVKTFFRCETLNWYELYQEYLDG